MLPHPPSRRPISRRPSRWALAGIVLFALIAIACSGSETDPALVSSSTATTGPMTVQAEGYTLQLYVDKPAGEVLDLIVAYHGTIGSDAQLPTATQTIAQQLRRILTAPDVAIVSVGYPQQGRLIGQSMPEAEAGLRWCLQQAERTLGFRRRRMFLIGHSQGGYVVTRLATRFGTDGVVANAPGPLDLGYRCTLEASGMAPPSQACSLMAQQFGTSVANPTPYTERSLLAFTRGYLSDLLFVQGLDDSPIQLANWSRFQDSVRTCTSCRTRSFLDVPGYGHGALFDSPQGQSALNTFLQR